MRSLARKGRYFSSAPQHKILASLPQQKRNVFGILACDYWRVVRLISLGASTVYLAASILHKLVLCRLMKDCGSSEAARMYATRDESKPCRERIMIRISRTTTHYQVKVIATEIIKAVRNSHKPVSSGAASLLDVDFPLVWIWQSQACRRNLHAYGPSWTVFSYMTATDKSSFKRYTTRIHNAFFGIPPTISRSSRPRVPLFWGEQTTFITDYQSISVETFVFARQTLCHKKFRTFNHLALDLHTAGCASLVHLCARRAS